MGLVKASLKDTRSCAGCRQGQFDRPLAMAFQPIIDVAARSVFAYEALVRGPAGESAGSILETIGRSELYAFDQACRVTAIETAAALGLGDSSCDLSINFLPNAVYETRACIRTTLQAAARTTFPTRKLIFEIRKRGQTARRDSHDAVRCDSTLTSGTEVSVGSWIDERRRMGVFQAISG